MYQLPRLIKNKNLIHAFSDKSDGNMALKFGPEEEVQGSRTAFLGRLGIEERQAVLMEVQHGTGIQFVDAGDGGKGILPDVPGYKVDALIAAEDGIFPFLLIGDCLPVVIYEPEAKITALVHLGWRNTDKRFVQLVIKEMEKEYSATPEKMLVGIGPAIHKESYIFSGDEIRERKLNWPGFLVPMGKDKTGIDIIGYNIAQLKEIGISSENIETSHIDTAASASYFSHYRSRTSTEPEGRIAAVAGMKLEMI